MAVAEGLTKKQENQDRSDLVAYWSVPLCDGVHSVEFEHGTLSGKRILRVDGKEVLRRDWMFKLVGDEHFTLGPNTKCVLKVEPMPSFTFGYLLLVDGKPLKKFTEAQSKVLRSWTPVIDGKRHRVVLERQTLEVWVDGERAETESEFVERGVEMRFEVGGREAVIHAASSCPRQGVQHILVIDGHIQQEDQ